jgi:UDP-N-acetylmuramate--alanine ligase
MRRRIHVVGIGGSGLSAIARVLHERGEIVTGSDQAPNALTDALVRDGVPVAIGHRPENVVGADLVLVTSAARQDNPEVVAARTAGIPVRRRESFLEELTAGLRTVAVAGTHGKTTTTSLVAWILRCAGRQPGFVLGGVSPDLAGNASAGGGSVFVIEADEYDRAFLGLRPNVGVVTNVEYDHPDLFPSRQDYRRAFEAFIELVRDRLIVCADDPVAAALTRYGVARETYGLSPEADWRAEEIRPNAAGGSDLLAFHAGRSLGLIRTRLPGRHNVLNTLAAIAAVADFEINPADLRQALTEFRGVQRRFTVSGEAGEVTVIDDYAHHPSEVRATLDAVHDRYPGKEVWAVFQPHTYSRLRALASDFAQAFARADHVVVTGVFASREEPVAGIDAAWLAGQIRHGDVRAAEALEEAARVVLEGMRPPAVVVTMSAGDGNRVGEIVLEHLRKRGPEVT